MKTKLSALLDGELDREEAELVFKALHRDDELLNECRAFQWVGSALRGEDHLEADLTARVMASLEEEATVLAPPRRAPWHSPLFAVAASVAGILFVAGAVLMPRSDEAAGRNQATMAAVTVSAQPVRQLAVADMQDYLIAHQAHSSGTYLMASPQQIRNVSMVGPEVGK
ncbi:MAG TPA: RseA family anti-sigma factor [Rhodocyclaceae bacterium]